MNYTFNHQTREIALYMTTNEFDMLTCIRLAAVRYQSPFNEASGLKNCHDELDRINRSLTLERIRSLEPGF